jgi:hypothetical protein
MNMRPRAVRFKICNDHIRSIRVIDPFSIQKVTDSLPVILWYVEMPDVNRTPSGVNPVAPYSFIFLRRPVDTGNDRLPLEKVASEILKLLQDGSTLEM